jgi:sodium transport system ATP-binding protein
LNATISTISNQHWIDVRGLTKFFHDPARGLVRASDHITFRCDPGMVYGLLGPNGAGKTTTLRMLSTVFKPSEGTATIWGYDVVQEPESVRRVIGFLSGDTGLYGRLSARETLTYFGELNGLSAERIRERVDYLADRLDMRSFLDSRCGTLSTGQKQRVSIARTLIHDPPVLILDEPTAGLDIIASTDIIRFIRDERANGKCIIFSTHFMREAEKLCDRIGILYQGRIHAQGSLEDLQRQTGIQDLEDIFMKLARPEAPKG